MAFAVLHIEKAKSSVGGLGDHNDRSNIPLNADPEKQDLNRVIIDHNEHGGLKEAIENRISKGYKGQKKIRKDAVRAMNIVLSGSHDRMKEIDESGNIDKWIKDNQKFLENEFGKENIVSLYCHRDERTPHLHAVVVPLTTGGQLSAKKVMGNRIIMSQRQSRYGESMSKWGLSRGIEGSRATHDSVQEYYSRLKDPTRAELHSIKEIEKNTSGFKGFLGLSKEKLYEIPKDVLDDFILSEKAKVEELSRQNENLYKHVDSLKRELDHVQASKASLGKTKEMLERKLINIATKIKNAQTIEEVKSLLSTNNKGRSESHTR